MDSITQFTLWASIGLALWGRKYGNKAARRGGFLWTVPDLDVFIWPLLYSNPIEIELFHRWFMHSITFSVLAAPVFGYIISKLHKDTDRKLRTLIAFFALFTHPILDLFTGYGTQILYPFSQQWYALDSVFIVDPLYSIPLFILLVTAFVTQNKLKKVRTISVWLAVSTAYLARSLLSQSIATRTFTASLQQTSLDTRSDILPWQGEVDWTEWKTEGFASENPNLKPTLIRNSAAPLNTLLRKWLAEDKQHYYFSRYGILDSDIPTQRYTLPKNLHLLDPYTDNTDVQNIITRRSPLAVEQVNENTLRLNIVRYGKLLARDNFDEKSFMFNYTITELPNGSVEIGSRWDGDGDRPSMDKWAFGKLWKRILWE